MADQHAPHRATSQLPASGQIFLDHVGHFVADADAGARALVRAGFAPTQVSVQVNPDPAGAAPLPAGTGNVCVMLTRGYLEVLFKTADTALGRQLDAGLARYPGLHLAAFAVADGAAHHARLTAAGFRMQPLVDMRRPVGTADGEGIAAFSVVRVEPGEMPEGRIQLLRHRTEDTVWQPRWLGHPNSATGLVALVIAVADVPEAGARFSRFLDRPAATMPGGVRIVLDRGVLDLISVEGLHTRWPGLTVPGLPFMAVCTIEVSSLAQAAEALTRGRLAFTQRDGHIEAPFPDALGQGMWIFAEKA